MKFASILTSVTLLAANKQSFLGSLSDFGLPNNANVFGVFANCDWAVAYIHYRNGKYDFQIVFTSEYSHGMVVVGGGSMMNYSEIL